MKFIVDYTSDFKKQFKKIKKQGKDLKKLYENNQTFSKWTTARF